MQDPPAIEFVARQEPEDFQVEELALYEPTGEGAHTFLWVEKRGMTTREAVKRLARALGRPERCFGAAGRKDRHALTRQWLSVEEVEPAAALALELEDLRVLRAERHPHKLRTGQLRANRFRLRLRALAEADRPRVERRLAEVARRGLPNAFGPQRFGVSGDNAALGRLLVEGRFKELAVALAGPPFVEDSPAHAALRAALAEERRGELTRLGRERAALGRDLAGLAAHLARWRGDWKGAVKRLDRELTGVFLGALQARVFNRVLARRVAALDAPAFDELAPGDLAFLHDRGAVFLVERPEEEAERLAAFELSPSGPVVGHRLTRAEGRPGELEAEALAAEGLELADFRGIGGGLDQRGARRPLRVPVAGLELAWEGADAVLAFELPKGSYATTLLAELDARRYGAPPA